MLKRTYEREKAKDSYPGNYTLGTTGALVRWWLGDEWMQKYVDDASPLATYLRIDDKAPPKERMRMLHRFFEFAEALFNLQNIEGFECLLDELSYGKIEAACAEIDIAKLLFVHRIKFRIVRRQQKARHDYDLEIFYPDGFKVCAETECKIEAGVPRAELILDKIKKARSQLPDDQANFIFIKVPESWILDTSIASRIVEIASGYLKQSTHVMSVKFYSAVLRYDDTHSNIVHVFTEVSNLKFPQRDWKIFDDATRPREGQPTWWTSIYPDFRVATDEQWQCARPA